MEKASWHLLFLLYLNVAEESFRLCALMDWLLLPENTAVYMGLSFWLSKAGGFVFHLGYRSSTPLL